VSLKANLGMKLRWTTA